MYHFPTVWVENSPDSLLDIAIRYCIRHRQTFCKYNNVTDEYELQDGLYLPLEISERMLQLCKSEMVDDCFNKFLSIFKDTTRTRLRRLDFSNLNIEDSSIQILCKHNIVELDISDCKRLTHACLPYIACLWNSLESLNVGKSVEIFLNEGKLLLPEKSDEHLLSHYMGLFQPRSGYETPISVEAPEMFVNIGLPKLRKFIINGLSANYFVHILNNASFLTYLDLSTCELNSQHLELFANLKQLTSLILCNVFDIQSCIPAICRIKSLRHLDISGSNDVAIFYPNPNRTLKYIVDNLENLVSLDISGTNLAGKRTRERESSPDSNHLKTEENLTDIPGLAGRVNNPLEFLGLLNTSHDACYRHHIPALRITGDATEEQILNAGQVYCARKNMIQKVLNDLFQLFRFSTCKNSKLALDVVMEAMRMHLKVKHIQVSGSASLFYIVKGEDKKNFNIKMRKKIIKVLLDAMFSHYTDVTMLRNACLTLIHFKIPDDVFFDYERLVSLLLLIVAQDDQDEFVQRIGVYLLNSLACQVDGFNKKLVGDRGAITIMLQLIEKRLMNEQCDEVMETAWSTMWNVTDETPVNCARFLEGRGMELFLGCLRAFPHKPELLRNMMGLLGNVAEVKDLRRHLMKDEYLCVFSDLLSSESDGIEVSYNAAGILSHIASDGEEEWNKNLILCLKRRDVLQKMVDAIEKWDLGTKRNINYRSFEPILRLLNVQHTPEVQHWAVWALANLTRVYPEKYCSLLKEEGGLELLKKLLKKPGYSRILELAEIIIKQCEKYEKHGVEVCTFDDDNGEPDILL